MIDFEVTLFYQLLDSMHNRLVSTATEDGGQFGDSKGTKRLNE
jgi:hypothetical protein